MNAAKPAATSTVASATPRAKGIQSIEIGFRLVAALIAAADPQPLKRIAQAAAMSPSKARMYLVSLIRVGLIAQDDATGLYALGPAAADMGSVALKRIDLFAAAQLAMDALGHATGALTLLSAWSNGGVVLLRQAEGAERLPIDFRPGGHVSLTRTATGHAFLAFLSPALTQGHRAIEVAENLNNPDLKFFDDAYLDAVIKAARANLFTSLPDVRLASGIILAGYTAVAAPIFDHTKQLRMVLTVLHAKRGAMRDLAATRAALLVEARRLSGGDKSSMPACEPLPVKLPRQRR